MIARNEFLFILTIATDSTGFSTTNSSKWFDIRVQKENSRKEYLKLHVAVDVQTGIIHQVSITDGRSHDSPVFESLIKYIPHFNKITGDGAYSSKKTANWLTIRMEDHSYLLVKLLLEKLKVLQPGKLHFMSLLKIKKNDWMTITIYWNCRAFPSIFGISDSDTDRRSSF